VSPWTVGVAPWNPSVAGALPPTVISHAYPPACRCTFALVPSRIRQPVGIVPLDGSSDAETVTVPREAPWRGVLNRPLGAPLSYPPDRSELEEPRPTGLRSTRRGILAA